MSGTSSTTTATKENNRHAGNTVGGNKKFMGGNQSRSGKVFKVTSREAIHQFAKTLKSIADYVSQEYTHGGEIRFMIENLDDFRFVRPQNPDPNAHQFEVESWKKQLDLFWKQRGIYKDNKMKLYSLVWGRCSKTTQRKIETHQNYQQRKNNYDSLKLTKIIHEFVFKSND
jgi:hypothetical protein